MPVAATDPLYVLYTSGTAAGDDRGAVPHGLGDPRLGAPGGALVNHRPDLGGGIERIADRELRDAGDESIEEVGVHPLVHDDALHRDARLPGIAVAAGSAGLAGAVEIGIGFDDDAGVAAQLQRHTLGAGLGPDVPSRAGAPGEADHPHAVVRDQAARHLERARHHGDAARGVAAPRD